MIQTSFEIVCSSREVAQRVEEASRTMVEQFNNQDSRVRAVLGLEMSREKELLFRLVVKSTMPGWAHDKAASGFADVFNKVGATVKEVGRVG